MLRWNKVLWLTISITKQLLYFSVPMLLYNFSWHQLQEMGILGVNYNSEFTHTECLSNARWVKNWATFFRILSLAKDFLSKFNWHHYQEGIDAVDSENLKEFEALIDKTFISTSHDDVVVGTVVEHVEPLVNVHEFPRFVDSNNQLVDAANPGWMTNDCALLRPLTPSVRAMSFMTTMMLLLL